MGTTYEQHNDNTTPAQEQLRNNIGTPTQDNNKLRNDIGATFGQHWNTLGTAQTTQTQHRNYTRTTQELHNNNTITTQEQHNRMSRLTRTPYEHHGGNLGIT